MLLPAFTISQTDVHVSEYSLDNKVQICKPSIQLCRTIIHIDDDLN